MQCDGVFVKLSSRSPKDSLVSQSNYIIAPRQLHLAFKLIDKRALTRHIYIYKHFGSACEEGRRIGINPALSLSYGETMRIDTDLYIYCAVCITPTREMALLLHTLLLDASPTSQRHIPHSSTCLESHVPKRIVTSAFLDTHTRLRFEFVVPLTHPHKEKADFSRAFWGGGPPPPVTLPPFSTHISLEKEKEILTENILPGFIAFNVRNAPFCCRSTQ
jgi:hypothetical protein